MWGRFSIVEVQVPFEEVKSRCVALGFSARVFLFLLFFSFYKKGKKPSRVDVSVGNARQEVDKKCIFFFSVVPFLIRGEIFLIEVFVTAQVEFVHFDVKFFNSVVQLEVSGV